MEGFAARRVCGNKRRWPKRGRCWPAASCAARRRSMCPCPAARPPATHYELALGLRTFYIKSVRGFLLLPARLPRIKGAFWKMQRERRREQHAADIRIHLMMHTCLPSMEGRSVDAAPPLQDADVICAITWDCCRSSIMHRCALHAAQVHAVLGTCLASREAHTAFEAVPCQHGAQRKTFAGHPDRAQSKYTGDALLDA